MTDNSLSLIFILVNKLFGTRKGYLINVFFNFFSRHSHAMVRNSKGLLVLINYYPNFGVA